jgi:hypothetical protein
MPGFVRIYVVVEMEQDGTRWNKVLSSVMQCDIWELSVSWLHGQSQERTKL